MLFCNVHYKYNILHETGPIKYFVSIVDTDGLML